MGVPAVRTFVLMLLALGAAAAAHANGTVRLAWDANTEPDVAGYVIDYGTTSGQYPHTRNVGLVTQASVEGLTSGVTYYFTVRAYNTAGIYSERSQAVSFTPPVPLFSQPAATELLWRHTGSGALASWAMNGVDQVSGTALTPGQVADTSWTIVGTGHFNADERRDIVWQHRDGWIAAWLMNGVTLIDGQLLQPDRVADTNWRIAAVADLNADGRSDLVWQNGASGDVAAWLMNGTSLQDGRALEPGRVADLDWRIVGSHDFNADGRPDLLWYHRTQGLLAVWFMNGTRQTSGTLITAAPVADSGWTPVAVQDVDTDGDPDIIWQHAQGQLAAWVMSGTTLVAGVALTPDRVVDTQWRVVAGR